jgi:hypothetical protein
MMFDRFYDKVIVTELYFFCWGVILDFAFWIYLRKRSKKKREFYLDLFKEVKKAKLINDEFYFGIYLFFILFLFYFSDNVDEPDYYDKTGFFLELQENNFLLWRIGATFWKKLCFSL